MKVSSSVPTALAMIAGVALSICASRLGPASTTRCTLLSPPMLVSLSICSPAWLAACSGFRNALSASSMRPIDFGTSAIHARAGSIRPASNEPLRASPTSRTSKAAAGRGRYQRPSSRTAGASMRLSSSATSSGTISTDAIAQV